MYEFEFTRPTTLADALAVLKEDEEAQALAGGQTLIPALKQRLAMPSKLVSLMAIEELRDIRATDGVLSLGGGETHRAIAHDAAEAFPGFAALAGQIGDAAVRTRGTIGGSLANNDPSACYPAAVLACGGTIVTDRREIAADDYFQGMFATALEEGEIITRVNIPIPEVSAYVKFAQPASRFALVGVFVARFPDGARVGVTGASEEGVFRWTEAETALSESFTPEAIDGLTLPAEGLISDIHGSASYRAHIAAVIARRAVAAAH